MVDPKLILAGVELLKTSKNAGKITQALEGDSDVIKGIMSSVTEKKMSKQDIKTFAAMTRQIAEKDMGAKGQGLPAASLAKALIGGPWAVVADAAGAVIGNLGKAGAENIRNTARNIGGAYAEARTGKTPRQLEMYGYNPMERALLYQVMKQRTKKENVANMLEGLTNAASQVLGTTVGAYRTGKMYETMRDSPLSGKALDQLGRYTAKNRGERFSQALGTGNK